VTVVKERPITMPDEILSQFLSETELAEFKKAGPIILSVTVYGEKPELIGGGRCCCD